MLFCFCLVLGAADFAAAGAAAPNPFFLGAAAVATLRRMEGAGSVMARGRLGRSRLAGVAPTPTRRLLRLQAPALAAFYKRKQHTATRTSSFQPRVTAPPLTK